MKTILLRAALALSLAFGVAGCADQLSKIESFVHTVTSTSVSSKTIVLAIQSFDVAKVGATGYLRLRRCTGTNGPVCRDPLVTRDLDAAIQTGTSIRNDLKAWVRANPTGDTTSDSYDKLVGITASIERAISAYTAATR